MVRSNICSDISVVTLRYTSVPHVHPLLKKYAFFFKTVGRTDMSTEGKANPVQCINVTVIHVPLIFSF